MSRAGLEGANKAYDTRVIIGDGTYRQVSEDFLCRPLGRVRVKGKSEGVMLHELVAVRADASPDIALLVDRFSDGIKAYYNYDWDKALAIFSELNSKVPDKVVTMYIDLAREHSEAESGFSEPDDTVDIEARSKQLEDSDPDSSDIK